MIAEPTLSRAVPLSVYVPLPLPEIVSSVAVPVPPVWLTVPAPAEPTANDVVLNAPFPIRNWPLEPLIKPTTMPLLATSVPPFWLH